MGLSPAQILKQRKLAERLGREVPAILGLDRATDAGRAARTSAASEHELLLARLGVDLRRLHSIQALEKKIEAKAVMIEAYLPWVQGLLSAEAETGKGVQDEILVQMMIWLLDLGRFDDALPVIGYVLKHELVLPERFKRTAATLIAEESADAALKALGQGKDFDLGYLLKIDALTGDMDMIDQVRAKLMKAIGLLYAVHADASEADSDGPAGAQRAAIGDGLRYLRRALDLDAKAGVKTAIRDLERAEKRLAEDQGASA